ncbi:MAG: RNA polymerase sigma factor [Myxococcota bacterium]
MPSEVFQLAARAALERLGGSTLTPEALARALERRCGGREEALSGLRVDEVCIAQAALAGDATALERLERDYLSQVAPAIARLDPAPPFVEDQLQQLRARMLVGEGGRQRLDDFDGRGSLAGFLRASGVRLALNARRGVAPSVSADVLEAELATSNPEFEAFVAQHGGQLTLTLREVLSALPEEDRRLLRLAVIEGHTTRELGLALGVSHATVARRLQQTYAKVLQDTRRRLAVATGLSEHSMDSFIGALREHVELSMSALLTRSR